MPFDRRCLSIADAFRLPMPFDYRCPSITDALQLSMPFDYRSPIADYQFPDLSPSSRPPSDFACRREAERVEPPARNRHPRTPIVRRPVSALRPDGDERRWRARLEGDDRAEAG